METKDSYNNRPNDLFEKAHVLYHWTNVCLSYRIEKDSNSMK